MPNHRKVGAQAITKLSGAMAYFGLTDAQSGFRVTIKRAIKSLAISEMGMVLGTEILSKAHDLGLKAIEVPITVSYIQGSSKRNPVYQGLDVFFLL